MDVVIAYRQSFSEELVYMLRSLQNLPHDRVYIIGDRPRVSGKVIHLPYKQTADLAHNTLTIMNMACEDAEISDDFIWIPDDVFIMQKLTKLSVYHRGKYADIIKEYKKKGKRNYYTERMQRTYNHLLMLGVEDPLCYELHVPFVINKEKWNSIKPHVKKDHNKLSMYGNLNDIGGTKARDVKVRRDSPYPTGHFVSTHDSTFGSNKIGKMIRDKFPERSIYEI